jgi:hypothetical protein
MGITIAWEDNTQQVMRYSLDEHWTWEEFFIAKKQANEMMDAVSHKFGVIVDVSPKATFRPDILPNLRKALSSAHPNTLFVVLVTPHPYTYTMLRQAFSSLRFSTMPVEIVPNLEEGHHIMAQRLREQAHLREK